MILRIIMLITGTFLLTYTTSPIALTDGLELLLSPLKKIKVPIHELSMMMCIALRFIPTLIEETDKIMSAQRPGGRILKAAICCRRPGRWCRFWCRCLFPPSAGPTNWQWPWSAAATMAGRGGQSCMCCAMPCGTTWCSAATALFWRR